MAIKIRAKAEAGMIEVRCLMLHPMETGLRKDEQGEPIPEHFIREATVERNGAEVLRADFNSSVAKNPYLRFRCAGQAGDAIRVSWIDNRGAVDSGETRAK